MKKRLKIITSVILIISLLILSGCSPNASKYKQGRELIGISEVDKNKTLTSDDLSYENIENLDSAINIFTELGEYKDSAVILQLLNEEKEKNEAKTNYNNAVMEFEAGNFDKALELFELSKDYYDFTKYKTAAAELKRFVGEWSKSILYKDIIEASCTISGPFIIKDSSNFSDCDWSVTASISIYVDKVNSHNEIQEFYINETSSLDHLTGTPDTEISDFFIIKHSKFGQQICNYNRRGNSLIKISLRSADDLQIYEEVKSVDYSTTYASDFVLLSKD